MPDDPTLNPTAINTPVAPPVEQTVQDNSTYSNSTAVEPGPEEDSGQPVNTQNDSQIISSQDSGNDGGRNKRVIATILGIVLLIAAVGTGVFLVGQQQEIRIGAWDCKNYVFEVTQSGEVIARNGSTRFEPLQQARVFINGQQVATCDVPELDAGDAASICTVSVPQDGSFSWEVVGTKDCEDDGQYQPKATPTPTPSLTPSPTPTDGPTPSASPSPTLSPTPTVTPTPPPIGAACLDVKAYDTNWSRLSSSELSSLKAGDVVRFAVGGTTNSGSFDKARFTINGSLRSAVSSQKPGTGEFFDEYTIPDGPVDFTVSAQINHSSLGWI